MKKRLFLSIVLPENVKSSFISVQFHHPDIRWTPKENLHITVAFFGDVEETMQAQLETKIENTCSLLPPFSLKFQEAIFAPLGKRFSTMIWGLFQENEAFERLTQEMTKISKVFHLHISEKKQLPHVTLARFKKPQGPQKLSQPSIDNISVTSCDLMASKLTPEGSIYTLLRRFPMKNQ